MNSCEEMQLKLFFFVSRKFEFSLKWHKVSLTNIEMGIKKDQPFSQFWWSFNSSKAQDRV